MCSEFQRNLSVSGDTLRIERRLVVNVDCCNGRSVLYDGENGCSGQCVVQDFDLPVNLRKAMCGHFEKSYRVHCCCLVDNLDCV